MKKIGIIGFGNMGSAIASKIKSPVIVFDKDNLKTKNLKGLVGVALSAALVVENSDVIILAVKPQDLSLLLEDIEKQANKLFISIAAGITTGYIEKYLDNARVIRAMPNVGAKIGKSVTCICKGSFATQEDLETAKEIFNSIGEVQELSEDMMDAATAISGSGPAYYFRAIEINPSEYKNNHKEFHENFISSLSKAARDIGFDDKTAEFLSRWTVLYSDLLLKETRLKPEELRKQVTSKGGTTEAALEVLHKGGSLVDAVRAAVERAKTLSRG
jgi:pyrroline-5-carboxylate reductase